MKQKPRRTYNFFSTIAKNGYLGNLGSFQVLYRPSCHDHQLIIMMVIERLCAYTYYNDDYVLPQPIRVLIKYRM